MVRISSKYAETLEKLATGIRKHTIEIDKMPAHKLDRSVCCYFCLSPIDINENVYIISERETINNVEFTSTYYMDRRCYRNSFMRLVKK